MISSADPSALLRNAEHLERAGRLAEAEAVYVQVLTQWPNLPNTWYNLALLQRRSGRFDTALASYQQALDRGVTQPEEVHLNRGVIYSDCLRQEAAAEKELQAALALNPKYIPALLNLANLREDFGKRDAALGLYERILALQPHNHEALSRYANLKSTCRPDDPLIDKLQSAIANTATTSADKASLGFALGKLLDACGCYDRAFNAYVTANRYSRESASPQAAPYDPRQHELFVAQLIATFTSVRPNLTSSVARPIFVCGMFRSGSTLTEQVLAAHSRVTAGGEIGFLPSLVRTQLAPFPAAFAGVTPQQLDLLAARYLEMLSNLFPGSDRVTDKRPDNFLYIGLIKQLFPNAKIIHTTRGALDNCLSVFFLHLDHSMGYASDLLDTAHYYAQYRRLMSHWKSLYGADILDFDYDAFVREPREAVAKLLEFCALEWEESCLQFQQVDNAVKTASVWQVREPLYSRSSGRWRNYAAHLAPLRGYLRDLGIDLDAS
ncbi:MAG TPA: sulfotransferase [Steroidobacteraceae bacterium]|jgi:tetratricopeptide (TPR) repeat protein